MTIEYLASDGKKMTTHTCMLINMKKIPSILLINFIINIASLRSRFLVLRLSRSIPDWYCKTCTCLSCILVKHALGIQFVHDKIFLFQEAEQARNPYFDGPHNKVAAKKGSYNPRHQWIGPNPWYWRNYPVNKCTN